MKLLYKSNRKGPRKKHEEDPTRDQDDNTKNSPCKVDAVQAGRAKKKLQYQQNKPRNQDRQVGQANRDPVAFAADPLRKESQPVSRISATRDATQPEADPFGPPVDPLQIEDICRTHVRLFSPFTLAIVECSQVRQDEQKEEMKPILAITGDQSKPNTPLGNLEIWPVIIGKRLRSDRI